MISIFVFDEHLRQAAIREMERDLDNEIEDAVKLYEDGFNLIEIAQSKDVPVRDVIDALTNHHYIYVNPKDIFDAEKFAELEDEVENLFLATGTIDVLDEIND